MIERIVALTETNVIGEGMVDQAIGSGRSGFPTRPYSQEPGQPINKADNLKKATESYERNLIEQAIREFNGNKNKAAKKLSLTRQSLQYKINKYGIKNE